MTLFWKKKKPEIGSVRDQLMPIRMLARSFATVEGQSNSAYFHDLGSGKVACPHDDEQYHPKNFRIKVKIFQSKLINGHTLFFFQFKETFFV